METDAIYRNVSAQNVLLSSLTGLFDVFRYHNRWKTLNLSDFIEQIDFTWTDKYKVFLLNNKSVPSKTANHMEESNTVQQISSVNRQYVEKIKLPVDPSVINISKQVIYA